MPPDKIFDLSAPGLFDPTSPTQLADLVCESLKIGPATGAGRRAVAAKYGIDIRELVEAVEIARHQTPTQ